MKQVFDWIKYGFQFAAQNWKGFYAFVAVYALIVMGLSTIDSAIVGALISIAGVVVGGFLFAFVDNRVRSSAGWPALDSVPWARFIGVSLLLFVAQFLGMMALGAVSVTLENESVGGFLVGLLVFFVIHLMIFTLFLNAIPAVVLRNATVFRALVLSFESVKNNPGKTFLWILLWMLIFGIELFLVFAVGGSLMSADQFEVSGPAVVMVAMMLLMPPFIASYYAQAAALVPEASVAEGKALEKNGPAS